MEKEKLVEDLCSQYCSFYKSDKGEELACKGFSVLLKLVKEGLDIPARPEKTYGGGKTEDLLFGLVCSCCPFFEEDCDFASRRRGEPSIPSAEAIKPCGGFLCLCLCMERGAMDIQDINRVI